MPSARNQSGAVRTSMVRRSRLPIQPVQHGSKNKVLLRKIKTVRSRIGLGAQGLGHSGRRHVLENFISLNELTPNLRFSNMKTDFI
jgi:hypothetical protein